VKIGSIYVYKNSSGKPVYTGSTQDGNNLRRHRTHLRVGKSRFERWLLSFPEPRPLPEHIETVEFENAAELFVREDYWMTALHTHIADGGLNLTSAQGRPDHSKIAAIGGRLGGLSGSREAKIRAAHAQPREAKVRGGLEAARNMPREVRVRAGRIGGRISACTFEQYSKAGRIGVRNQSHDAKVLGGRTTNHIRWHLRRGKTSPTCSLCQGAIQKENPR